MNTIKLQVDIPEDHRLVLTLPADLPVGPAELTLISRGGDPDQNQRLRAMGMDLGRGKISEDFEAPLPEDLLRLFEGEG